MLFLSKIYKISDEMLGSFSAWFWNLLVLQRHGVSLPGDFVEAVLLLAAAGNRICRKTVFFWDFRRSVREFFGVVLELARPSEAWCFPAGKLFFRSCFTASSRRQQNLSKNAVFLRFQKRR